MRARSWPCFTGLLKSAWSSFTWPEICDPTSTVFTAESVPEAETVAVRLPRSTFARRCSGAALALPKLVQPHHAAAARTASATAASQRGTRRRGGSAGMEPCVCSGGGYSAPAGPRRGTSAVAGEGFLLLFGDLAAQRAQAGLHHRVLVEVGVAGLDRKLHLQDRRAQVAVPRVVLALVVVVLGLAAERRVGAGGVP